ncbi:stimulus-sensing domain-containing protein [Candidatus Puniceispirillum sp.]|nr:stimulus-sensing domain-containing protein [Candidatus Puniceispirillum sp.]
MVVFFSWICEKVSWLMTCCRMSRLTARIMAIMLFPIAIFLVGLLSIDQYRTTLIQSEFVALERQGFTLARSLALAEAERDRRVVRRLLSPETMTHLLPLVGLGSSLRARVFQPNGLLLADTARNGSLQPNVEIRRREGKTWRRQTRNYLNSMVAAASGWFSPFDELPEYIELRRQRATHYPEVIAALSGEARRALRVDRLGNLLLSVAVPVQDLRLVRGALMVSIGGGKIEQELANVNIVFLQLSLGVLVVTLGLSLYLARSITTPISRLAAAADKLRQSADMSRRLQRLPHRNDEIGQLSDSLIDLTDELQKRIQATAAFAADVAHEIKNPLSSLRSATETFSRAKTAAQKKQLLTVILQDVQRLDRLITDISKASRIDNEIISQELVSVDFVILVDSFVEMRAQTYSQNNLHFERLKTPLMVKMNESRIVQVIDNILSNSISFSPKHGSVKFVLRPDTQDRTIALDIMDDGPGIPETKLETVFDRFYTERPINEKFGEHSGLGLSIARQIVDAHRGCLSAHNRQEGGACLRLVLPMEG